MRAIREGVFKSVQGCMLLSRPDDLRVSALSSEANCRLKPDVLVYIPARRKLSKPFVSKCELNFGKSNTKVIINYGRLLFLIVSLTNVWWGYKFSLQVNSEEKIFTCYGIRIRPYNNTR